jgi:hypothetical protein
MSILMETWSSQFRRKTVRQEKPAVKRPWTVAPNKSTIFAPVDLEARRIVDEIPVSMRTLLVSAIIKDWAKRGKSYGVLNVLNKQDKDKGGPA